MQVEIVIDVACSGSYRGYTHFARAARRFRDQGGTVLVRFAPFQLDADAASDGEPLLDAIRRKFGEGAVTESAHIAELAAADGIDIDYDRAVHTNMFGAHQLIASAGTQGLGERMTERLFRAHFADGLNVGDANTLASLADEIGVVGPPVGSEAVRADLDRVRQLGIRQIPVFRFEGGNDLTGNLSENDLLAALKQE